VSARRVLLVDDEPAVLRALTIALQANGYEVLAAMTGEDAVAKATAHPVDLLLLDLGLPGIDGFEVIRRLRVVLPALPIIVLSAQGEQQAKVEALDLGADDYVEKPFGVPELLARVRASLRRADQARGQAHEATRLRRGEVELDLAERRATVRGETVELSRIQFDLLALFARHPGRLLTHRAIVTGVWGEPDGAANENLRMQISHLRRRIEADPRHPRLIVTDPGLGYRFLPDAAA
jgi:two-component system KDP operon response regulator KdpE